MSLAGILDDAQAVLRCHRQDRVHVSSLAEEVYRNDGAGSRRHGTLERVHVDVVALRVGIYQDWEGSEIGDR
jgi:hypothetical protein